MKASQAATQLLRTLGDPHTREVIWALLNDRAELLRVARGALGYLQSLPASHRPDPAWLAPLRAACEESPLAASSPADPVRSVVRWYDPHTRLWCVQCLDADLCQVGTADYLPRAAAEEMERAYLRAHGAQRAYVRPDGSLTLNGSESR